MADGSTALVGVVARPHPLQRDTYYAEAKAGQTIAQILGDGAADNLRVELGGEEVPRSLWPCLRPKAGQRLHVTAYPKGSNNKLLKVVVVIVAIVYAYWTGDFATALKILAYGFTVVNLLVPPPMPKAPGANGDAFDPLSALTGTQNRATIYSPVPLVLGTVRFYPTHAALPYTEICGDEQFLRMLLDLGPGTLDVSDIKIGETPIANYDGVDWEVSTTPTLFTHDVYELQVGTNLNSDAASDTRTSQTGANELSIDLQFPSGLFGVDSKGRDVTGYVSVSILYRKVGDSAWSSAAAANGLVPSSSTIASDGTNFTVTGSARRTLRVGLRWKVPAAGQYEVLVRRVSTSWSATTVSDYSDMTWTVLRSISPSSASTTGTNKLALRIRATDQLNSVVSTVSVVASQRIPVYDHVNEVWVDDVATSNNAWIYHWLLTSAPEQAVARRVSADRMDLDAIIAWAQDCDAMGYGYNQVEQGGRSLFDLAQDVLAGGRATFGMRNGRYSCVRDIAQSTPVQMFTPANSWDFRGQRAFFDPPHALRCQFINPEANNQEDELVVYAGGYDKTNATRFEKMDLRMCSDPTPVWRLATYHLEASAQRQNVYTWMADVEFLVCERGDLVSVASDVVEWGVCSARVKSISGDRLTVTLAGVVPMEAGKLYAIQVRSDDAVQAVVNITTTGDGDVQDLVLAAALPANVQIGDLAVVGERNLVTMPLIVQRIEPQNELTAKITGVDAAPSVPAAGTGTAPTFVSSITGKPWCEPPEIPVVNIRVGDSAPDDAGVIYPQPGFGGTPSSGIYRVPLNGRAARR
ncbi:MAG TPA: host specificity factor TipJ family phage tail protein [Frateuria sp.]|uniref:host specificity factor TipJ family phage tail protein n=1 Tax=Frateuria sp. TaxID=2211372 RepID=UPI002D7EF522|nr:host specificity factor TipJ family phage tail protein [Frateuria sp.]HET6805331.1 host specificity factor TipJ family phage tail protein [Frateuria sp.]